MHLNRSIRTFAAIAFAVALFVAPTVLAADPLAQSQSQLDTAILLNSPSWLAQALDVLSGWLTGGSPTSFTCPDGTTDCSDTSGPMSPDGMPSPDNGPGLDPNG